MSSSLSVTPVSPSNALPGVNFTTVVVHNPDTTNFKSMSATFSVEPKSTQSQGEELLRFVFGKAYGVRSHYTCQLRKTVQSTRVSMWHATTSPKRVLRKRTPLSVSPRTLLRLAVSLTLLPVDSETLVASPDQTPDSSSRHLRSFLGVPLRGDLSSSLPPHASTSESSSTHPKNIRRNVQTINLVSPFGVFRVRSILKPLSSPTGLRSPWVGKGGFRTRGPFPPSVAPVVFRSSRLGSRLSRELTHR